MKILAITDNHSPTGGAERYYFELNSRLEKMQDVEICSVGFGSKKIEPFILRSQKNRLFKLVWQMITNPIIYYKLRRIIKEFNPDIIHLHNNKQYSASVWSAIKKHPIIQTVHDHSYICPVAQNIHRDGSVCATGIRWQCFWQHRVKYNRVVYLLLSIAYFVNRRKAKKTVAHFITPSPLLAEKMRLNGFAKVTDIAPFVAKYPKQPTPDPMQFLFVGNLGKHKGTDILLREFALAQQKNSKLRLLIVGTGPELQAMQEKVHRLKIEENVQFLGWQDNLIELYAHSTALIFPSTGMESFGLVITEAMAHGRAVIGVNFGTAAWLIDDKKTGLLFTPYVEGDLAEKIVTLATDPQYCLELGRQAKITVDQRFDNDKALNEILRIYYETSQRPCSLADNDYSRN